MNQKKPYNEFRYELVSWIPMLIALGFSAHTESIEGHRIGIKGNELTYILGSIMKITGASIGSLAVFNMIYYRIRPAQRLVTSLFFRYTRNPAYIGWRAFSLGAFISNPTLENLASASGVFVTTEIMAIREEKSLEHRFGDEYTQYKEEVPRWIPLRKYKKDE